jgi:hypothetical protein
MRTLHAENFIDMVRVEEFTRNTKIRVVDIERQMERIEVACSQTANPGDNSSHGACHQRTNSTLSSQLHTLQK